MHKFKAETLTEFLIAVFIFGLLMIGFFNFMAVQTENAAMIKIRDDLTFRAQWLLAHDYEEIQDKTKFQNVISYDIEGEGKILKVYRNGMNNDKLMIIEFKN